MLYTPLSLSLTTIETHKRLRTAHPHPDRTKHLLTPSTSGSINGRGKKRSSDLCAPLSLCSSLYSAASRTQWRASHLLCQGESLPISCWTRCAAAGHGKPLGCCQGRWEGAEREGGGLWEGKLASTESKA